MKVKAKISGYSVVSPLGGHWEPFSHYRTFEVEVGDDDFSTGCVQLTKGEYPIFLDFDPKTDVHFEDGVAIINSDEAWSRSN